MLKLILKNLYFLIFFEVDFNDIKDELKDIFIKDEKCIFSFIGIKRFMVFTNKRIILIYKSLLGNKGRKYILIPYKSIKITKIKQGGFFNISSCINFFCLSDINFKIQISKSFDITKILNLISNID